MASHDLASLGIAAPENAAGSPIDSPLTGLHDYLPAGSCHPA